jgi:hypothetical protein
MTAFTPTSDPFVAQYAEADTLMSGMDRRRLHEAVRLLGCASAYARRYGEHLPFPELVARIRSADNDPAADALVTEGMALAVQALRAAGGEAPAGATGD